MGWFTKIEKAAAEKLKAAFIDAKQLAEHAEADIAHAEQALQAAKVKAAKAAQSASQAAQAAAARAKADVAKAQAAAEALAAEAEAAARKAEEIMNRAAPVAPVVVTAPVAVDPTALTPAQLEQVTDPEAPPLVAPQ